METTNEQLLKNFRIIQASSALSDDGNRCLIPPHPELKMRLINEVEKLKNDLGEGLIASKLTLEQDGNAGFNDGLIIPGDTLELGTPLRVARSQALTAPPLRGNLQVLVVLVEFPGLPMPTPTGHFNDLFFSNNVIPTGSVNEYFNEVTNGLIDVRGQVVGPFIMPHPIDYYANGTSGTGRGAPNARNLATDAANALGASFNLAPFDNNNDGYVDAFVVIHAGAGAEVTGSTHDIWSHKWVLSGNALPAGGSPQIYSYLTVPADCKLGVCAHELGHLLFGFPDLYDTTYKSNGIGDWCLMSGGSWNNNGDTPAHPGAWCKCNQSWVNTIVPNAPIAGVVIEDVKKGFEIYKLWKSGNPGTEYFLAENRQLSNFDAYLPGAGLLVWHIDDSITDNTNKMHYRVALEQADGLSQLEQLPRPGTSGDSGDPYPGSTGNTSITDTSTPNTISYAGLSTSVSIQNIITQGNDIICDIAV